MAARKVLRVLEWSALTIGVLLLLFYVAARADREVQSRTGLEEFETAREAAANPEPLDSASPGAVDMSLWAEGRIRAYRESLEVYMGSPLAILRIPKIRLEVPVLEGTDELTLNRAVGRIAGTARPGGEGNLGVAGHRDGFFRGLKDLAPGDELELETLEGEHSYRVAEILIVEPEDVYVLEPTPHPSVTLVTCYPFYFVGSAPQRYIVRATQTGPAESVETADVRGSAVGTLPLGRREDPRLRIRMRYPVAEQPRHPQRSSRPAVDSGPST